MLSGTLFTRGFPWISPMVVFIYISVVTLHRVPFLPVVLTWLVDVGHLYTLQHAPTWLQEGAVWHMLEDLLQQIIVCFVVFGLCQPIVAADVLPEGE